MPTCTWLGIERGVEYAFEIGTVGAFRMLARHLKVPSNPLEWGVTNVLKSSGLY